MKAKVLWDFGDGQTSESLNPGHVYLHPGVYRVTLTVKRPAATSKRRTGSRSTARGGCRAARSGSTRSTIISRRSGPMTPRGSTPWCWGNSCRPTSRSATRRAGRPTKTRRRQPTRRPTTRARTRASVHGGPRPRPSAGPRRKRNKPATPSRPKPRGTRRRRRGRQDGLRQGVGCQGDEDLFKLAERVGPLARDALGDVAVGDGNLDRCRRQDRRRPASGRVPDPRGRRRRERPGGRRPGEAAVGRGHGGARQGQAWRGGEPIAADLGRLPRPEG